MGDRRKLQGEIDRCLKKVNEGVELFEDIWQKVQSAPNHNQKDKYEQELKKEIKKLQRHRDQIKGWLSSPDVKDKTPLQEARKQIETEMERFKMVEREMKTKAYSNHGLDAGLKGDPQEKEKEDCIHWITEGISELQIQIYKFEADMESISATMKKRKADRDKQERLEETKHSIERHRFHIESLEKILRAMDNEAIDLKLVRDLRTDVEHYVKSNQEPDFEENDGMYDEIDMDNLTTIMAPVISSASSQSHPPSISNGISSNISSSTSTLMDLNPPLANLHLSSERTIAGSASNSTHGDNDLTTPSSTQPSSPTASPALSSTDEQKRTKFDLDDLSSQRKRSNSSTNGSMSTTTTLSHLTSPKSSSTVSKHSQSTPNPPHFNHSTSTTQMPNSTASNTTVSTPPVLPYSAIVSQNVSSTSSTTTTTGTATNANIKQQIFSPSSKQMSRQLSTDTNTTASTSHPPSLLGATNDRTNLTSQHSHNDQSQSNFSSSTVTLNNGPTISSTLYTNISTSTSRTSSNIPSELPLTNPILDPSMNSQQSPLLSRILPDNDRSINPSLSSTNVANIGGTTGSTISGPPPGIANGTSDSHSTLDPHAFPNLPPPSSASTSTMNNPLPTTSTFLPGETSTNNGGFFGSLTDLHQSRFGFGSTQHQHHQHQQSMANTRVPLTTAEQRMLTRLNSAFTKLPSLLESERQRTNANRIYARTPLGPGQKNPYYPQVPPTGSDTPEFYYRLAPDTLFFVFYYMEGTRAQYLAAKALKRQLWRFHTKHMMWFQRHEEPKVITDEYEQGAYIYFDYAQWQTQKQESFTFEYKFLEDREL